MRKVRINFGLSDCSVQSLVSESLSDRWQSPNIGLSDRWVQTKKLTSLFADLWSQSVFWTRWWSPWKTNPKREVTQYQEEDIEKVPENIEKFDRNLGDANDEFEGVNRKTEETKQTLDDILSASAEQEDAEARRNYIILYRVTESS